MISLLWWFGYVLVLAAAIAKIGAQNVQLSAFKDTSSSLPAEAQAIKSCGGMLTATQGVIQTPNFPDKFPVPIQCTWVIDASAINKNNVSIIVYVTQQYLLSGLKFTEYDYYSDDIKVKSEHAPFELNEQTVTQTVTVQFYSQYLEIKFTMDNLYGTHLRALDRLLDVYGFNITYEMDGVVKPKPCTALLCRYLGHCYATSDFSSYYCSCFPGHSGDDCGVGPLCHDGDKDFCENGGVCKQIGDAGVTCICPKGFKGKKCQIPEDEDINGCFSDEKDCDSQCHFNGPEQDFCKCTQSTSISNRERARYEATVRLGNASQFSQSDNRNDRRRMNEHLPTVLEKHVSRFLRSSNITRINDLEVVATSTSNMGMKIQFFGAKQDAKRVRDALYKMVERGRVANITLVPSSLAFREEAVLQIESVSINYKSAVRHSDEFILSCEARGSAKMVFRWYKNGVYVNQTKATRKIWSRVYENSQSKDHYTALLGVPRATRLDEGVYTCQVSDYGMQQCRSTVVHVLSRPELRLDPPSATVYRGASVRIRCLSSDIDQSNGYSWTKNNALFQSDAETELWEDLYPDGSILKINNIQKSANYTCVSSNAVGQVSKSVYVYVVDRGTIELCANETSFGVNWPASSPGSPILAECPKRYEGQSQRICELRDFGKPAWLTPNFSGCLADTLVDVYNEFRGLTFGYQKTNGSAVLKSCLEYAMSRHTNFLPGEAGFLLKLLQEVDEYLTERGSEVEQEVAADITLQILDVVLKSEHSLNSQQQVEDLQELVKSATLKRELITSPVPVPAPSTSLQYHQTGSFWTHKQRIKSLPFNAQLYGDHLFSDELYMEMALTSQLQEIVANGSMVLSVISYKNLTNFLPRMYFERNTHTPDVDYMTASRVIASWLVYANRTLNEAIVPASQLLHLPMTAAHVQITFQHENPTDSDWIPVCGYDLQATYKTTWNTDLCITENLMDNVTRCICPLSGTYVVLMAKRNYNSTTVRSQQHPMFVVVSCGCCFLQSCIAFGILLPILYSRKCSVTFLKMQFCTATSTAMAIFALGFLKFLPQHWYGVISSTLGGILLLGSSTLIAITMVIDSELGPRKSPTAHLSSGMRGAIGLSWFMPILYAITTLLIYTVMDEWPLNWWMTVNTIGFALFVIIETLFVILFSLLFYTLVHKLSYLAKKHDKHGILITKRIGLVYRITCLLVLKISTDILYLMYSNSNEILFSYIFGALCICLGFTLLFCFVIKAETKLKSDALNKSNSKQIIEDYCSGSINSPLNFYTNHEIEKENDCSVPSTQSSTKKLPLAITTRRYPLDRLQTTTNITDPYITTGGLCETTFLELNDPSANLDVNFIEFKQHPNQQQQQLQHHQQQQQQQTLSNQPSQYPSLLDANGYEMEIVPTDLSLYGSSCKPSQGKCYLSDTNDFVGVGSLDILQGVRQDSVIGIRSNYNVNDQMVNPDINGSNLSTLAPSTSNVTVGDGGSGLHSYVNQNQLLFDKNHEKSGQKILESANVHAVDPQPSSTAKLTVNAPPTITVTPTDDTDKTIDGMLDRISHDLDYLLNRMAEIPPAPPPPASTAPAQPPPPPLLAHNLSVHEVILEEEAEDL
ncbi:uncharacterized protein LOC129567889 [Sitodiplosis mosellana]|uniref:uncharacterized protein LOC129567889 n=1 Tax=Sitodiplosis mosellana TaxID=263140 RepID=UPI002444A474|nr:uncharacterized protein LOC129567889 [Sitodiplosis mosellana]XP_055301228.1 uncharacterized protein LOC129567889 [Sitodiplosis mosellana]XP_055301229.1 uncharacterized protein LOC129567889 [Sitodiplosis mosellana]